MAELVPVPVRSAPLEPTRDRNVAATDRLLWRPAGTPVATLSLPVAQRHRGTLND